LRRALLFAAVGEAATGLALVIFPSLVGQLLFGVELTGVALPVARVAVVTLYLAYVGGRKSIRQ
jgi:hypothetical protein